MTATVNPYCKSVAKQIKGEGKTRPKWYANPKIVKGICTR